MTIRFRFETLCAWAATAFMLGVLVGSHVAAAFS